MIIFVLAVESVLLERSVSVTVSVAVSVVVDDDDDVVVVDDDVCEKRRASGASTRRRLRSYNILENELRLLILS